MSSVSLVSILYFDGSTHIHAEINTLSTGFNYCFDALNPKGEENELVTAFKQMFDPQIQITFMMVLRNLFPILNIFVRCPFPCSDSSFVYPC